MPPSPTSRRLRSFYVWLLLSMLLLGGFTFALNAFHKVSYPFGWDDDEGAVWWESAHVIDLKSLYHPIQQYPYFVVPYPPVFHAVTWTLAKATGDFLVAGRLVCVFSAIGIALLLGLLVWHVSPKNIPVGIRACGATVATLLCFRLDALNTYIPEMGVDLFALFLSFLGLFLFLRFRSRPAAYVAFACFVLALFTKQTMVAAPLACLVAEAIFDQTRAVRHFLFCLALGIAGLAFLALASNGEALRHLFLYNASQPFSLIHWVVGIQQNLVDILPIAAVACLALLPLFHEAASPGQATFRDKLQLDSSADPYHLTLFLLGLQLLFALVVTLTYGKSGSGVHYFLEWNFICCALTGLLFTRALFAWSSQSSQNSNAAAIFLLVFLAAVTSVPDSLRRIDAVYRLTSGERHKQSTLYASDAAVLKILEQTPGPVLCENMLLVMKAHKEIPIEPGIQGFLGKSGIWDESGFVAMITQQKFGVIVMRDLNADFWTEPIVQAIANHYQVAEHIGDEGVAESSYTVYRPKTSPQ